MTTGIRIDDLNSTMSPNKDHELPAMLGGLSVKLRVQQINSFVLGDVHENLNTLAKVASALGNDADFAATVAGALAGKLAKNASNVGDAAAQAAFLANIGISAGDEGDIFYRAANGTLAKLAKGTPGQQLVMHPSEVRPIWVPATGDVLLATASISNVAAVDFTGLIDGTYDEYVLRLNAVVPATNGQDLILQPSTNNGSSWLSGSFSRVQSTTAGGAASVSAAEGASIVLVNAGSNAGADGGVSGEVRLYRQAAAGQSRLKWALNSNTGTAGVNVDGSGFAAQGVNALRLAFSSGNVASGIARLYGVRK